MKEREVLLLCIIHNIKINPELFTVHTNKLRAYHTMGFTEKAFDESEWMIRKTAYKSLGFTEKAFDDEDADIRTTAYHALDVPESIINGDYHSDDWLQDYIKLREKYSKARIIEIIINWKCGECSYSELDILKFHRICNFKIEPTSFRYRVARKEAYRYAGFTEKAFNDTEWKIRMEAYDTLGWTERAFEDEDWRVRLKAYRILGFTKESLESKNSNIKSAAKEYFELKEKYTKEDAKKAIDLWKLERL